MSTSEQTAPSRPLLMPPMASGIVLLMAFLGLVYVAYLTVRPVLFSMLFAAAVASVAAPIFRWVTRHLGGRRRTASLATVLFLFVGVFAPFAVVGTMGVRRLIVEAMQLNRHLSAGGALSVERIAPRLGPLGPPFERVALELRPKIAAAAPQIASQAAGFVGWISRATVSVGIGLFLFAVALYYFLLDGHRWRQRFERLVPLPAEDLHMFFDRFHRVTMAVVVGNFGTSLAQALAATLGFYLFGAPVPLIWGAVTLLVALIPMIGPALIWIPVSVAVGVDHGWVRGAGLAAYGLLVISTVDNLVRPMLTRRGLQLHPLLIFVAVFGGILSFGVAGIFVGPLVVALAVTVVDVYERRLARI